MSSKRQPSKHKRAAQNRNQRAARSARTANANAPASATTRAPASSSGGGSLLSRLRGGGAAAGSAPRAGAPRRSVPAQPPGYRAALSAVLAAAAALLLSCFVLRYPVDAQGTLYTSETLAADWSITALRAAAEQPDLEPAVLADSIDDWAPGRSQDVVVKALWPFSLALVLPLVGAGVAFAAVRRRATSKVVNRALYATLFGAVLTQGLLLLFIPVVLGVGVAMFQVRKAEAMAAAAGAADGGDGPGDVIDVDEVDEHPAEAPGTDEASSDDEPTDDEG